MPVTITAACTACGACLVTCPERALHAAPRRPRVEGSRCTDCLDCVEICPAGAVLPETGTDAETVGNAVGTGIAGNAVAWETVGAALGARAVGAP